jgi:hypothetical protein
MTSTAKIPTKTNPKSKFPFEIRNKLKSPTMTKNHFLIIIPAPEIHISIPITVSMFQMNPFRMK